MSDGCYRCDATVKEAIFIPIAPGIAPGVCGACAAEYENLERGTIAAIRKWWKIKRPTAEERA